jgi:hypothetical protein
MGRSRSLEYERRENYAKLFNLTETECVYCAVRTGRICLLRGTDWPYMFTARYALAVFPARYGLAVYVYCAVRTGCVYCAVRTGCIRLLRGTDWPYMFTARYGLAVYVYCAVRTGCMFTARYGLAVYVYCAVRTGRICLLRGTDWQYMFTARY